MFMSTHSVTKQSDLPITKEEGIKSSLFLSDV